MLARHFLVLFYRVAIVLTLAVLLYGRAFAADLPTLPLKALPPPVGPTSGFYAGLNIGGAITRDRIDFITLPGTGDLKPAGGMAGVTLGWQTFTPNGVLLGVEGDLDLAFTKARGTCLVLNAECSTKSSAFATQRVVIGAALPAITGAVQQKVAIAPPSQWPVPLQVPASLSLANIAPFLTAGIAERDIRAGVPGTGDAHQWLIGGVFGGGVRLPVSLHSDFALSYLYARFNKSFAIGNPAFTPVTIASGKSVDEQVLRAAWLLHL